MLPCHWALGPQAVLWFPEQSKLLPSSRVSAYPFPFAWNPLPCFLSQAEPIIIFQDLTQMSFCLEAFADASSHQTKSSGTPFTALIMVLVNNCSCHHFFSVIFPTGPLAPENTSCTRLVYDHFVAG